jgi:hypothetical protein
MGEVSGTVDHGPRGLEDRLLALGDRVEVAHGRELALVGGDAERPSAFLETVAVNGAETRCKRSLRRDFSEVVFPFEIKWLGDLDSNQD